uniref:Uncharacterized protein n=1 Tax=Meloidogyne enterolobii TaxID=390850 RepID=A0A6V7WZQ4_MELEN|nr:unnamed protein product [Meloidogyne enterolobii]
MFILLILIIQINFIFCHDNEEIRNYIDQFETWYSTTIKWASEGTENFSEENILDFNTTIKFGNYFRKFLKERNEHLQKLVEDEDKCINYYRNLKIKCTEKELEKFENTRIYLYKIYIKAYNLMKMFDFIWSILYALNPYGMKYLLKVVVSDGQNYYFGSNFGFHIHARPNPA